MTAKDTKPAKSPISAERLPKAGPDLDALMVLTGLARIDDPMVSYLVGMLIDRIAEIALARRHGVKPPVRPELDAVLAQEPHGVPFRQKPVM